MSKRKQDTREFMAKKVALEARKGEEATAERPAGSAFTTSQTRSACAI